MYIYNPDQWILLFFAYSFVGYIWEVLYVSAMQHKWVNRGFLRGPILPIYGFGAIAILHVTIPVAHSLPLVFLCGMVAATVLEYFTGAAMEKIFGVRYWDYSKDKGNVNGYICPRASFAWGVASVMLISLVHPRMDQLIGLIPDIAVNLVAHLLALLFAADTALSVKDAFDIKAMLRELEEDSRVLQKAAESAARVKQKAETAKAGMEARAMAAYGNAYDRAQSAKTVFEARAAFHDLNQNGVPDELEDLEALIRSKISAMKIKRPQPYKAMKRMLRNNPTATHRHLREAMERIRQHLDD